MTGSRRSTAERIGPPETSVPPRRRLLAERDARLYLAGQLTSMLGDSSLWLAVGIWVKALTGSSSAAALVWLAFILGGLTGPLTAVLVDRLSLRPVLITTNLLSAGNVLLLLFVHSEAQAWLVYPVLFGYGVLSSLLNAGSSALMKSMLGNELLPSANAVLSTAKQSMNLIAPVLGAGLFVVLGAVPVIVADAVSFGIAATALSLMRIRVNRAEPSADRAHPWAVLNAGMHHLMRTPGIRRLVLAASIAVLGLGFLEPAEFSVNSAGLHRSPAFMGVLFVFQGAGALLGGSFSARAVRAFGELRCGFLALAAMAAGTGLMAVPVLPIVTFAFALYGAGLTCLVVAQQTQVQRLTPLHTQGRTAGAAGLLTRTPQALGIAIGSGLIEIVGYLVLLALIVVLIALAAAWLFLSAAADKRAAGWPGPAPAEEW